MNNFGLFLEIRYLYCYRWHNNAGYVSKQIENNYLPSGHLHPMHDGLDLISFSNIRLLMKAVACVFVQPIAVARHLIRNFWRLPWWMAGSQYFLYTIFFLCWRFDVSMSSSCQLLELDQFVGEFAAECQRQIIFQIRKSDRFCMRFPLQFALS